MWFLCILFNFTSIEEEQEGSGPTAMEWQKPALSRIAAKTPAMVLEESHDTVASDLEYNSVIRQEYAHTASIFLVHIAFQVLIQLFVSSQIISKHRAALTRHIVLRGSDIRSLSSGQIVFLLTMHDMESMRSATGLTSSLVSYFINDSLNRHPGLSACMESIAEKVKYCFLDCSHNYHIDDMYLDCPWLHKRPKHASR